MKNSKGLIIQLTGKPHSGKSTLAQVIKDKMQNRGIKVILVDSNVYCRSICADLSTDRDGRIEEIKRLAMHGSWLAEDFEIVLIVAPNNYEEGRSYVRDRYNSLLVYLNCNESMLEFRENKTSHSTSILFKKEVECFEEPQNFDLCLDTGKMDMKECSLIFEEFVLSRLIEFYMPATILM